MNTSFQPDEKDAIFDSTQEYLNQQNIDIKEIDKTRPWGGFFVIDENSLDTFISHFFSHVNINTEQNGLKLSPKILLVQPGKRLSWQYHHRRSEIWTVAAGEAGVVISDTDEQTDLQKLSQGDTIRLKQGERHRLVGLDQWGVIAEIWQHTDPENPSDEEDIVRVEDDFGR